VAAREEGVVPMPGLLYRRAWSPDPRLRNGRPRYNDRIRQVHVHHTVNSNDYSQTDVPALLRGIYRYHTHNLGWSDIAYNFLVDRFGRAWVGRAGGAARPVRGAHTLGFNATSSGIAVIGNYDLVAPGIETLTAVVNLAAWKLSMYGRDPEGTAAVISEGSDKYALAQVAVLPVIDGHRDTNDTACPGQLLYDQLPEVRRLVQERIQAAQVPPVTVSTPFQLTGDPVVGGSMTVTGSATACGAISANVTAATKTAGHSSTQPVPITFPSFTFDPNNYPTDTSDPLHLQCYPSGGTCGGNDATDAVSSFNTYVTAHKTNLTGTFAVWQRTPSASTYINLDGITLGGDFTLITDAPVSFGNTSTVSTTSSSVTANAFVVSTYQPTGTCTAALVNTGGADCSIYGKNAIEFDSGVQSDPNDGVVGLLYTTGKMAFVNSSNNIADVGDGALYAQSMDFKNGFNVIYNSRVERVLGFGASYQQVLWQELNV